MLMVFIEMVEYGSLVFDFCDDDLFGQRQGVPLTECHLRHAYGHHAVLRLSKDGRVCDAAKIQEKQLNATAAKGFDQITRNPDAALGDRDGAEAIKWVVSGLIILFDRQSVTVQSQKGAVVTDNEMFHYVVFAFRGKRSGFLMISLVKSTSITGQ